jgi:hypothetical protein
MFLKINDLTEKEMDRLNKIFGSRLTTSSNVHLLVCLEEVITVFENMANYEQFVNDENFASKVSECALILYNENFNTFDDLYYKAGDIVHEYFNEED